MTSRLPITARPARNELAVSYLARLAALHDMPFAELWDQVSGLRRGYGKGKSLKANLLATATSQPRDRLERAIIELRVPRPDWKSLRHEPQRGCRRCNAGHPGGPVIQVLGHHDYVCTRHRLWIGPPDQADHPQPDLTELPEIVAAQHAHRRLLRRFGPAATFDAVLTALFICGHRWDGKPVGDTDVQHRWDHRARLLISPGTEAETFSKSRLFAVIYPEAIHVASLFASLRWRRLAAGGPDEQRQFTAEIGRRLGLADYGPVRLDDPIAHWIDQRCWKPPALPHSTFRAERTFAGPTFRKPVSGAEKARLQSASWFATTRRGGMLVPHRALTPVLPRRIITSDLAGQLRDVAQLTVREISALMHTEYLRPHPARDTTYLDAATEPAPWADQDKPRPSRVGHPWFPGS